ncbi:amidophosphoribosyltransferase [Caldisalinibacter kiritimatiensis]|uniref:Amidophosphoribosyltransferase n=1 Tax=Caldisalinibacter kiritimatiensis TaxID=1304284 RepID=R1CTZ4_9FIRM|nr:amidophosphoribosyltransferase [Caldisalinibacter kiritimatiensis]EOD00159.1 Amidophosphoribosyltransferase [Caldisalinibacter kiritimatiensis]
MFWLDDKLKEECGVFGVYSENKEKVSNLIYFGLYALQHRGQESAGIAVSDNKEVDYYKDMGLVSEIFNDDILASLQGNIGIGHVRYSTTGESHVENAQPLVVKYKNGTIALAHNGNLVNADALREILEDEGVVFQTSTDTEVVANLLARYHKDGIVKSVKKVMELVKGAFAFAIMTDNKLIGVRDLYGLRPLCIGKLDDGYVLASESCALDTVGAEFVRDVEPGEIVIIENNELKSIKSSKWCRKNLCMFELIYFARPDSTIDGINVYLARSEAGRILAKEAPVDADVVISVPDSGTPAAIGYAEESGIPYGIGLIKNKYAGRTFIQPTQELREQGVKLKLNVLKENVEGKRVVMVDDSIVRGTTSKRLVNMLKKAGAKEVHVRVTSPPVKYPCYFGIDTPYRKYLVGATKTVEEIRDMINADSLAYISMDGLLKSTGCDKGFCLACFNGDYPMEVPLDGDNKK